MMVKLMLISLSTSRKRKTNRIWVISLIMLLTGEVIWK